jgi:hypothetical protein
MTHALRAVCVLLALLATHCGGISMATKKKHKALTAADGIHSIVARYVNSSNELAAIATEWAEDGELAKGRIVMRRTGPRVWIYLGADNDGNFWREVSDAAEFYALQSQILTWTNPGGLLSGLDLEQPIGQQIGGGGGPLRVAIWVLTGDQNYDQVVAGGPAGSPTYAEAGVIIGTGDVPRTVHGIAAPDLDVDGAYAWTFVNSGPNAVTFEAGGSPAPGEAVTTFTGAPLVVPQGGRALLTWTRFNGAAAGWQAFEL